MNQKASTWNLEVCFYILIAILEQPKGYYYVRKTTDDSKGRLKDDEKRYPVKMEHNQIIPTKPIPNDKLKKEIENFKFFVQYANFKDINDYKNGDISYNPNIPS